MTSRRSVFIVGAAKWQVPLFEKARDLGVRIVASDIHADAPGFAFADATHLMDVRDFEGTVAIARRERVDAVVTGVDLAVPTVARVCEALGLAGLRADVAIAATDKYEMRRRLALLDLDPPGFRLVASLGEALEAARAFGWPCIVKPADNCGSRGVSVVAGPEELAPAITEATASSFTRRILVEELMVGVESSVEGIVDAGELHVLGICDKTKSALPYRFDLALHYPAAFTASQMRAIHAYIGSVVSGLGIDRGLVHAEVMVSGDRVRLIEIAARGCGAFVIGRLVPAISKVDVLGAFLLQALGERIHVPEPAAGYGLLQFIVAPPGRVLAATGIDALRAMPGVVDAGIDLRVGDDVVAATNTTGRHGYLLVHGESRDDVDARAARALARLDLRTTGSDRHGDPCAAAPQGG